MLTWRTPAWFGGTRPAGELGKSDGLPRNQWTAQVALAVQQNRRLRSSGRSCRRDQLRVGVRCGSCANVVRREAELLGVLFRRRIVVAVGQEMLQAAVGDDFVAVLERLVFQGRAVRRRIGDVPRQVAGDGAGVHFGRARRILSRLPTALGGIRLLPLVPCGFASFMGDIGLWRVRGFPTHRSRQKNMDEIAVLDAQSERCWGGFGGCYEAKDGRQSADRRTRQRGGAVRTHSGTGRQRPPDGGPRHRPGAGAYQLRNRTARCGPRTAGENQGQVRQGGAQAAGGEADGGVRPRLLQKQPGVHAPVLSRLSGADADCPIRNWAIIDRPAE